MAFIKVLNFLQNILRPKSVSVLLRMKIQIQFVL